MADSGTKTYKAAKRYIYAWGDGKAEGNGTMKDLLGGKGAGLAEMTNAGLPVPPGFTISTEVCNIFYQGKGGIPAAIDREVSEHVKKLERAAGATLGSTENPLLVSVRSGARACRSTPHASGTSRPSSAWWPSSSSPPCCSPPE